MRTKAFGNIVGKRENTCYHYFSPLPTIIFSKAFSLRVLKTKKCAVKGELPGCQSKTHLYLHFLGALWKAHAQCDIV